MKTPTRLSAAADGTFTGLLSFMANFPHRACCGCLVAQSRPALATPWTVAGQAPLSLGGPRQECWSGLPSPSSGGLPDPGIEPSSPALSGGFFATESPGNLPHSARYLDTQYLLTVLTSEGHVGVQRELLNYAEVSYF